MKHDPFAFGKVILALVLLLLMFKYCLLGRTTGALEMVGNRYKFAGFGGVIVIRFDFDDDDDDDELVLVDSSMKPHLSHSTSTPTFFFFFFFSS